mgnify:CR=1 FL=1
MTIYDKSDEIHAGKKHVSNTQTKPSKVSFFLDAVSKRALCKDTIIEIKVTTPDGESLESNLRLKESDLEVLRQIAGTQKRRAVFLRHASFVSL